MKKEEYSRTLEKKANNIKHKIDYENGTEIMPSKSHLREIQRFAKNYKKQKLDTTIYHRQANGKVLILRNENYGKAEVSEGHWKKDMVEEYLDDYYGRDL